jgi:glycogen debranching enzyme
VLKVTALATGEDSELPPAAGDGAARTLFALKSDDAFLIADSLGDVLGHSDGMFDSDTRVLSRFTLRLAGQRPSLLGAAVSQDNVFLTSNLTNHPLPPLGEAPTPQGVIHIARSCFLWNNRLFERVTLQNYDERHVFVPLSIGYGADFRDMFEVRGHRRAHRGELLEPLVAADSVLLRYQGLDGRQRSSAIRFSQPPVALDGTCAEFRLPLSAGALVSIYLEVGPELAEPPGRERHRHAASRARMAMRRTSRRGASLRSSAGLFDEWVERSRADLSLLTTELPTGPYPYAGIPWFSTPFGRDAIVTALQTLWINPALARGVLAFLSITQARETSRFDDSAPGKIIHEMRKGEMASLREVPFARYYGSVDSTPLFVMLAGAYAERTADLEFIDTLWPSLEAAMGWIAGAGDSDHDGFVDYARGEDTGLANQGWKDSFDSVFHANGHFPPGPIALVEVQGYVYAAQRAMSALALMRGDHVQAEHWSERAEALRAAVEDKFWSEELGFYALALDGEHRPCLVRASNPGHLLYVGLPTSERAARVIDRLSTPSFNSGWGLRTLARGEVRHNPMSYHNGSVWPHDTALCVAGMCRYGRKQQAVRVLTQTFEAAVHFGMRLPELFCGFQRQAAEPPIAYPVACLPQAWSSGAAFMMLQACLGVQINAHKNEIYVDRPELPAGINSLTLRGIAIGHARMNLVFQRIRERVVVFTEGSDARSVRVFADV